MTTIGKIDYGIPADDHNAVWPSQDWTTATVETLSSFHTTGRMYLPHDRLCASTDARNSAYLTPA